MLIKSSKWQQYEKERFQKSYKPFQKAIDKGVKKGYDFQDFSQDLYSTLYQILPEYPTKATPGARWAKDAIDELKTLPEFNQLRKSDTQCNALNSGLGATILTKHFAKTLPEMTEPNPDDVQQDVQALEDFIKDLKALPKVSPKQVKKFEKQLEQTKKDHQKAVEAWKAPSKAIAKDNGSTIRQVMRKALSEVQREIDQLNDSVDAFGFGSHPGQDGYRNEKEKLAAAELIKDNPKLKEIAKLAGRFRREAKREQANKKVPGVDEITDIESGNDLGRLLPSELMKIRHPILKKLFFKDYLEKNQMQYYLESVEQENMGPIVFCLDNSGSMKGNREVWSKAVVLGIGEICIKQNRQFVIIHFNSDVRRVDYFEKGKLDPLKLIESCAYFSGGGTDFSKPLHRAFKEIQKSLTNNDLRKADIVFITDGECLISDKDKERLKKLKMVSQTKIITVCIGFDSDSMKELSDKIVKISDLQDDKETKEIVFSI